MSETKVLHEWDGYGAKRRVVSDGLYFWYESQNSDTWGKDQCGQDGNAAEELARLAAENARLRQRAASTQPPANENDDRTCREQDPTDVQGPSQRP